MGWGIDRLGKIASGLGGGLASAVQAPFGLVKDAFLAGYEGDSLGSVFSEDAPDRVGQLFRGLLGPESGVGALVGGLPEGVRAPGRSVLGAAQTAYREGVAEPLSTFLTVSSLLESDEYKAQGGKTGFGGLVTGQTWRDAYKVAQHRSPGQALALTFTDDVMDDAEVEEFKRSDAYPLISGVTDAAANIVLDPTTAAGSGLAKVRKAVVVKPISGMADIERASAVKRLDKFNKAVGEATRGMEAEQATAVIRHRFFPNHASGPALSSLLADAGGEVERMRVLRAAAGDIAELDALRADSAALGNRVARAQEAGESLRVLEERGFDLPPSLAGESERLAAELDELYAEQNSVARREAAFGSLQAVPRATAIDAVRTSVTRSAVYQQSRFAAPLRVVFDMRPHRLVNLEDAAGDVQVARMLRKSALPVEAQEALRGEYARAANAGQRESILLRAEDAAVRSVAEQAGMTVEQVDAVLAQAGGNRASAQQVLRSRVYDGEGRSIVKLREDGSPTDLPLLVSQTANVLPLADLDAVRRATTKMGQFAARHPGVDIPADLAERFTRIWKPAVLLRPAWPMRVILDEQLRIAARIGALGSMGLFSTGVVNRLDDAVGTADALRRKAAELGRPLSSAERKAVRREVRSMRLPGSREVRIDGYELEPAFGPVGGEPNIYKRLASSRASFDRFFGRTADELEDGVRRDLANTGEWRSITPDERSYAAAWEHDVNRQIGADPLARRLLEDPDPAAAAEWLRTTPEGQAYARRLPYRRNKEQWARTVLEQVESYLPTPALREAALRRNAKASLLAKEVPDAAARPVVHGEALGQALGSSPTAQFVGKAVDKMYAALGSAPTDALSRQPFFDAMYQAEARRLIGVLDGQRPGGLTNADLAMVQGKARAYALKETRDLLYDLAEESELSHLLRFVAPFFNAWQEVGTVWAGLAVENPAFVRRLTIAWQAPDNAGLVQTDEQGEKYVVVPVPGGAKSLPYVGKALGSVGDFRFNKAALNTMLGGLPGTGPLVQIPVYQIAKDRPDLASNGFVEKVIFPFGVPSSLRDMLLPATAKRLYSLSKEEEDRAFATSYAQIMATETVNYNLHKRGEKPTHAEVLDKTRRLYALRAVVSWTSPVGGTFDSPYQLHIEAYRNLRAADPLTADAKFLDLYGEDYFALTTAVSKSMDGLPATLEAWQARREAEGLVSELRDPKMAGLIVGAEGAGEFNRSVYEYQLATAVRPGSSVPQRERLSPEEQAAGAEARLGWLQYRKLMDTLDAELTRRGLRSYQAREAEDLALIKKNAVADFGRRYPAWYADYNSVDRGAFERRLEDMRMIAADPRLSQRPDIAGLGEYLRIRDAVAAELRTREAKTLDAESNADIKAVFAAAVDDLVLRNLAFSDLFRRYLDRDKVAA